MPAKSKQQQKFMGIVRAIQKGDEPASKFSKDAQDAADDMKKKDVEDFASTKHKGLPKKVEQYLRQQIRKSVEEIIKEDWFDRLSKDEKEKYIKAHPNSKKAKQAAHDKEREKIAKKIRSKDYTIDGDGNIIKVKKLSKSEKAKEEKRKAKHLAAIKKGYFPGDDNYNTFMKEDYVETCGYTQSVDGKKLKTPGGTGKEDRKLKEGLPTKIKDLKKIKKVKPEPDSQKGTFDSIETFTKHHAGSMGAGDMGKIAEPDTYDWDDSGTNHNKPGHQTKKNKKKRGYEPVEETSERDYKAEYKKFQSSTKAKKYRAELNKYNRQKGTYGNGDGKDASHKGGKIVGFEAQSKNRGRAEKSRLKKEMVEEVTKGKGVQKIFDIHKNGYGKLGGRILDSLSAGLFVQLYDKAPDNIKEKMNKMNEKRLYIVIGKMWDKFGKGVKLS